MTGGDGFVSDDEITDYLNAALCELYDELLLSHGETRYMRSQVLTVTSGSATAPTDWMRTLRVEWAYGSVVYPLEPQEFRGSAQWGVVRSWSPTDPPRYRVSTDTSAATTKLYVYPTPSTAQTVTIHYLPLPFQFALATPTAENPYNCDEVLVLSAAIKMLAKEESPTQGLENELERQLQRIRARAGDDRGLPRRVADIGGWGVRVRGVW